MPRSLWGLSSGAVAVMVAVALSVANAAEPVALPVDEDIVLKQPIGFTPPGEEALDAAWLRPPEAPYPFPESRVETVRGVLRLTANGEVLNSVARSCWTTTLTGAPLERQLREAGLRFFVIDTDSGAKTPDETWEMFRGRADKILAAVPDAWIMARVWFSNVGEDFVAQYPEALLTGPTGITDWGTPSGRATHHVRPNGLNEWRRYCGAKLYEFMHRLGASPYAPRLVGVHVGALNTGEWWLYKGKGDPGWDYSRTRLDAFRLFLERKYGPAPGALAAAWGVDVSLDRVALPSLEERRVWPPRPCGPVSDYNQVLNLPVTNAARYFAAIIKAASHRRCLAGAEIHAGLHCFPTNGTVFLTQLLDCPDIDLLGGPASYDGRGQGSSPLFRECSASLARHGKLWFNEGDYRTHTVYGTGHIGDPPPDPAGTIEVLRREFCRAATKGYVSYLMDFGWNWFYDRDVIRTVGECERLRDVMTEAGLERHAEIAAVADQESQLYYNYFGTPLKLRAGILDRLGAEVDFYELRDFLADDTFRRYKMVVFLNVCALSAAERAALERVKSDGRLLLWMHTPGVINLSRRGGDPDADLEALTGLRLATGRPVQGPIRLQDGAYARLFASALPGGSLYDGPGAEVRQTVPLRDTSLSDCCGPMQAGNALADIACVDPEAVSLGLDAAGECRLALRRHEQWTSVYTASCLLRPEILTGLARLAGCHVYLDTNDVLFAAGRFVAVHAVTAGDKRLRLPAPTDVIELFTRQVLGRQVDEVVLPMRWGETRLLYLGDPVAVTARLDALAAAQIRDSAAFAAAYPAPAVVLPFFRQQRLQRPVAGVGPFPLKALTPTAFLYAGPYPATPEAAAAIAAFAAEVGRGPALPRRAPDEAALPDDEPTRRQADRYLYLEATPTARDPAGGPGPWQAGSIPGPWLDDYQVGAGEGQAFLIAFYLEGQPGQAVELAISARGQARAWFDGDDLRGPAGALGTVVTLTRPRHLVMVYVGSTGGPAGLSCKILAPGQTALPGQQLQQAPEGVRVWLAPE